LLRALPLSALLFTAAVHAQTPPAEVPAPVPIPAAPVRAEDKGDFKVVYEKVTNPDHREIQAIFRGTKLLEVTANALNEELALPVDVTVALRECGTAGASYERETHRISLCYELVSAFADMFLRDARRPEDAERAGAAVGGATVFVLFHEAGHALIDLYQLPVEGREEEAADQLSMLVLLSGGKEGEGAALDGASTLLAEEEDPAGKALLDRLPFWSGHALTAQRFSNVICWVYGKNPAGFQDQVDATTLPPERALGCPAEYERIVKEWEVLLAPYAKRWEPVLAVPAPPAPPSSPGRLP
jgi:hypothetical protein